MNSILVLGDTSQAHFYRALLSPCGYAIREAATATDAKTALRGGFPTVVLWILKDPREVLGMAKAIAGLDATDAVAPPLCVVALTHTREPAYLRAALECKGVRALLALDESGHPDARDLLVTVAQICAPRVIDAHDYLSKSQIERSMNLTSSVEKGEALDIVRRAAAEIGCNPYVISTVVTTAEEMISNAFHHGPVDDRGRHTYSSLPRSVPITLPHERRVTLTFAADDKRLCVSVLDRFGSLRVASLAARLASCLHPSGAQIAGDEGGAGIGMLMALRDMHGLAFNVLPGQATQVVALARRSRSFREFRIHPKSFGFFCGAEHGNHLGV
jgi:hypothetical protein